MGNTKSKAAVASVSEQCTNVASSTVQSCEVSSTQSQTGEITNNGWSFWFTARLEQKTDVSSTCFSDVNKQTTLQNQLINTISNATTADGIALLPAFGSTTATAKTNLTNIIRNNVTMSNIQRSYSSIRQEQTIKYTNNFISTFDSVELTQGAKLFAAATLKELDKAGIFNTISNYVDQAADADTKSPLDIFGSLATYAIYFIAFIVFLITGAIIYSVIDMSDDDSSSTTQQKSTTTAQDA